MNTTISVIVPVYNIEKFLDRCIKSIISQTYENLEIILVDDGSTDRSGIICDAYGKKDKRIKVIHKKNNGQASARNDAMKIATGKFFSFIDADDYIMPDMLEKLLKALLETDSDMSICGVINDYGYFKKEFKYHEEIIVFNSTEELLRNYFTTPLICDTLWNKLYKRELWNNLSYPEIRAREDRMILYKVYGRCNKVVRIPDLEYVQFIRSNSTEQGHWNDDYIYSLQAGKDQQKYISEYHPDLLPYVELIVADSCCNLMKLLLEKKAYNSHKRLYLKLYGIMKEELDKNKTHSPQNEKKYKYLQKVYNRQILFKAKTLFNKFCRFIALKATMLLNRIK